MPQLNKLKAANTADNTKLIKQITMIPENNLKPFCFNSSTITLKLNASFKLLNLASLQRPMISNTANTNEMTKEMINVIMIFNVGTAVSVTL